MRRPTPHRVSLALLAVSFALLPPGVVQAAVQVATLSIVDLDVPMRGTSPLRFSSLATAISSDGTEVVGSWLTTRTATSQQGWLVPDSTGRYKAVDIGSTGGQGAALTGVNNSQTIVGSRRLNGMESAIYALPPFFDPNTGVLMFRPQPIAGLTGQSRALGINDKNGIVGFDSSGSNGTPQAFYAAVGEKARHIDKLGGAASMAFAVNDDQAIAGWAVNQAGERQAFIARSASGEVTLPDILGSHWSEARAINQRGDIAGCFAARTIASGDCSGSIPASSKSTGDSNSQEVRAFLVQNGKAQVLDLPQGYTESFALGLSASGIVVGKAHAVDPITGAAKDTAFLWVDGTTLDLSQYLPAHDPRTGWESLATATAVTGSLLTARTGDLLTATIVGQGMMWGPDLMNPATQVLQPHAFRLDVTLINTAAIPEPATWLLLIAGVGLVGWTARQRLRAASLVRGH